ncbi:DUF2243 domain-containing protein [Eleftheria terrae]|uniref:DUF2243 domain-containing protein n=1 Tax=Eleftheria terrae TaxID=1597781 RepID=UPI00263AD07E|nr:DUF2243 domain-containing protein [Eleftheria terrae]WKB52360.1 DUF2243 domain-containing protein [Eleftheria terrae]
MSVPASHAIDAAPGRLPWGAALVGFGLGGFFDGILLHQILQWHHLLSGLQGGGLRDLRVQVMADGLFHALMYLLASAGLLILLRERQRLAAAGSARLLLGWVLLGFGIWHGVDAVLSHWLLGLHRIRMDTTQPLAWDLGWLLGFGLLPMWAGWRLCRRGPAGIGGQGMAVVLAALALGLAAWAAQPPRGTTPSITLLLAPGVPPARALAAAERLQGRIVWTNAPGTVWILAPEQPRSQAPTLQWHDGVLAVGSSLAAGVCLSWRKEGIRPPLASGT